MEKMVKDMTSIYRVGKIINSEFQWKFKRMFNLFINHGKANQLSTIFIVHIGKLR